MIKKDLYIDLDILHKARTDMVGYLDEITGYFKRLDEAMDRLKNSDWKSEASKEFFDNYKTYMQADMALLVLIVKEVCDGLGYAEDEYYKMSQISPLLPID